MICPYCGYDNNVEPDDLEFKCKKCRKKVLPVVDLPKDDELYKKIFHLYSEELRILFSSCIFKDYSKHVFCDIKSWLDVLSQNKMIVNKYNLEVEDKIKEFNLNVDKADLSTLSLIYSAAHNLGIRIYIEDKNDTNEAYKYFLLGYNTCKAMGEKCFPIESLGTMLLKNKDDLSVEELRQLLIEITPVRDNKMKIVGKKRQKIFEMMVDKIIEILAAFDNDYFMSHLYKKY